jgi:hypothetical protein
VSAAIFGGLDFQAALERQDPRCVKLQASAQVGIAAAAAALHEMFAWLGAWPGHLAVAVALDGVWHSPWFRAFTHAASSAAAPPLPQVLIQLKRFNQAVLKVKAAGPAPPAFASGRGGSSSKSGSTSSGKGLLNRDMSDVLSTGGHGRGRHAPSRC